MGINLLIFLINEDSQKLRQSTGRKAVNTKDPIRKLHGNCSGKPESRRLMLLQQTIPGPQAHLTTLLSKVIILILYSI